MHKSNWKKVGMFFIGAIIGLLITLYYSSRGYKGQSLASHAKLVIFAITLILILVSKIIIKLFKNKEK